MVIIYTSKTCGPCASLKKFYDHKGVEYQLRDIELPRWANAVVQATGQLIVPVSVIGKHYITGLNYRAITEALNERV
jgi:glutaredoxin